MLWCVPIALVDEVDGPISPELRDHSFGFFHFWHTSQSWGEPPGCPTLIAPAICPLPDLISKINALLLLMLRSNYSGYPVCPRHDAPQLVR